MAEAGEPIAMAAGSVLRAARISLGTAPRRDQMYDTATAVSLDSAWLVNHIEADGQTRPRRAASEYLYYSLVESRSTELP